MHRTTRLEVEVVEEQDLVAAPVAPLVLAALAEGESNGYAIVRRVRELSEVDLDWGDAMVYPLLHRLRRRGMVTAVWRSEPEGRRRRYYAIAEPAHPMTSTRRREGAAATRHHGRPWGGMMIGAPA